MRPIRSCPAKLATFTALATGLLGLLGLTVPDAWADHPASAAAGRWHVVARLPGGTFAAVTAPAEADAWAFGSQRSGSASYPVAEHWNGRRWSAARRVTGRKNSGIVCAGSSSARNVWAFAEAGSGLGNPPASSWALRLRNGRFVTAFTWSSPSGTYITGCDVLGPADAWAFGGEIAGLGRGIGTWHLTRSGWTPVDTGRLVLFNASAVSGRDVWAAGADVSHIDDRPALGRWNGSRWTEDSSIQAVLPKTTGAMWTVIYAVHAISDRDVWVEAAISKQGRLTGTLVVHWNGARWSRVKPGSLGYYLPTAVPDGQGGWWSPPYQTANGGVTRYLLHEAHGRWARFPLPGPLYTYSVSLAHVPRSRAMLATGLFRPPGTLLAFGSLPGQ